MLPYNPPPHNRLDILYQDAFLLVINKPAGVLSVPGRGPDKQDCMISRVQASYPDALIVHRLDMATSGILVLALDADTHRQLSRQFQQREVSKQYIAVVTGRPTPTAGLIDKPMICDWPNRPRQIIDYEQGKPAQTRYETLEYMPASDTSRVLLSPVTGRTHQLRLHMQSIGHAILGDGLYASPAVIAAAERLLLHASSLSFPHPANGARIVIESAVPF
ncbi:pseudouridine synthase [Sulfuriflexus sp.]|uniref:pseudouridine synthase n=1 Tax=Sulfuriflexus sp. TaxID=2015443 RepID=UPI00391F8657